MALFKSVLGSLKKGLSRTRETFAGGLRSILMGRTLDDALIDELEARLIQSDVGVAATRELIAGVRADFKAGTLTKGEDVLDYLKNRLKTMWPEADRELILSDTAPSVILVTGVNGVGKTTSISKLCAALRADDKTVLLGACDTFRAGAVRQLEIWGERLGVEVVKGQQGGDPAAVAFDACAAAKARGVDVLILDTAGRLHINDDLMGELRQVNTAVNPHQIYLVIDAMTGQDAVNSAKAFNDQLELDGVVLTKFDSDTRGGAALSVKQITGKPIKFIGVGEKLDALEAFHPTRIASRILGMGDVVSLVEKAQEQVSEEEALAMQDKISQGKMTMDDFLKQLRMMRRMGSMKSLLGMLPGIGSQLKDIDLDDKQIDQTEAIIQSMTSQERKDVDVLTASRRRRVAKGSGTDQQAVGKLVKGFEMVSKMGKQMSGMGALGKMKAMRGMDPATMGGMGGMGGMPRVKGSTKQQKSKFKQRKRKRR